MGGLVQGAAFAVAHLVEREQYFGAEFSGLFNHLVHQFAGVVGHCRQLLESGFCVQHFVHHELHVAQGRGVLGHVDYLFD